MLVQFTLGVMAVYAAYRLSRRRQPISDHRQCQLALDVEKTKSAVTKSELTIELCQLRQERFQWLEMRELDQRVADDAIKEATAAKAALRASLESVGAPVETIDALIAKIEEVNQK